jgi:hypothetical protein
VRGGRQHLGDVILLRVGGVLQRWRQVNGIRKE